MLPSNMPLDIGSAFTGKVLKASAKSTYTTIFYHEPNLDDGFSTVVSHETDNDNFARQNFLVKLPRVVRFFGDRDAFDDDYRPMIRNLADEFDDICFSFGRPTSISATLHRWVRDATPDPAGSITAADIYAGDVLTFIFKANNSAYSEFDEFLRPNANYIDDYAEFVAKHARHRSFRCHIYNAMIDPLDGWVGGINEAIAGSAGFAALGPGLGTFGWDVTHTEWDISTVAESELRSKIVDFFDL